MPIVYDYASFSNIAICNLLKSYDPNKVSKFQFKLTKARLDNYKYEIDQIMTGNSAYWSKPNYLDRDYTQTNLLFVLDDNSTDVYKMENTKDLPREHWLEEYSKYGIIKITLIGKLYLNLDQMCRVFGYNGIGKQGKFMAIKTDYNVILDNLKNILYHTL